MKFLSYNWNNSIIADQIDEWFSENNIKLQRDIRDLEYKQSIKEFMKTIRDAEFVIMIICAFTVIPIDFIRKLILKKLNLNTGV